MAETRSCFFPRFRLYPTELIGFTFFVGNNNEQLVNTTRLEIYKKSVEIAAAYDKETSSRSFVLINRDWARNALYKYKKGN